MQQEGSHPPVKKSAAKRLFRAAAIGVAGFVIFAFGVGVGSDRFSFGWFGSDTDSTLPAQLDYSSVDELYNALRANYDGELDVNELLDGMLHGLAAATGDPYTVYLNTEEAAEFREQLNGTFSGIGAELGVNDDGELIIVSPIEDFPAAQAGLRPQDVIVAIDGENATGLSIHEAVQKIRGPKGTEVELQIARGAQVLTFTITRDDITIASVESGILEGGIGYLQVNRFGEDTARLAREAAREFRDQNVSGVVLDLRGNPGGILNAAIDLASLWLPRGETVLVQQRGETVVSTETATGNNLLDGMPTVVLINEGSASGSEIVAGALKDTGAATLFGAETFGKGSVQEIHPLRGGAELKVTIARWYTPDGQNIDAQGIAPDRAVDMTDDDYIEGRDPQKDVALDFLR